jgi:hypothetical protein
MNAFLRHAVVSLAAILMLASAWAQPNSADARRYRSGYSSMMKLGKDIYDSLKPEQKQFVSPQPISIETDVTPFIRLLYYADEPKPIRGVWISAGFIDLVNNVAHARAIDKIEKGYFARYIQLLSQEASQTSLRPLPSDSNPNYWTEDMLNEQLSNFNSIVGVGVGIKLAHHYLGHYERHKEKLFDASGQQRPINNLLTEKEWHDAFAAGVRNALNAGCTIEGVLPLFEAFDKMKTRPAWTAYFIPDEVKFSKTKKDMERIQRKFFAGED